MRKLSFRGAATVVCDWSIRSLNWTRVQSKKTSSLFVIMQYFLKGQVSRDVITCRLIIGYWYFEGTYCFHPVGQQCVISLKTWVSISSALRISNLVLKCFLFLKYCICIIAQRPAFLAEIFFGFLCPFRQLFGHRVKISHYHNISNFKIPEEYSLVCYVAMLIDN